MRLIYAIVLICLVSITLLAQGTPESEEAPADPQVSASAASAPSNSPNSPGSAPLPPPQVHPAATVYSHGYEVRADIHKYASYATLPLFAAELALGQSLYNDSSDDSGKRGIHAAVGTGIIGLAGVNTFTGLWNMWESRHDTNGRTLRLVHGILMMASDAGFVATTATAPSRHHGIVTFNDDKVLHRNIAIASISIGTAGYLLMLFGHH